MLPNLSRPMSIAISREGGDRLDMRRPCRSLTAGTPGRINTSIDGFVGARNEPGRDRQGERICGLAINHQFPFLRRYDRELLRPRPMEDAAGINTDLSIGVRDAWAIAQKTAGHCIFPSRIKRRNLILRRKRSDTFTPVEIERI